MLLHLHGKPERASLPGLTRHADLAAHDPDDFLRDGEPETRPAVPARRRPVGLLEGLKNLLLPFPGDADPRVADGKSEDRIVAPVAHEFARDGHPPFGSELEGVADQVDEHLPQANGIAREFHRQIRREERLKGKTFLPCLQGKAAGDGPNKLPEIKGRFLEGHLAGLDPGQVKDVVDEAGEAAGLAVNRLQESLEGFIGMMPEAEFRHPDDAVERRADLVTHLRQELALGQAGRFRVLLFLAQRLRPLSFGNVPRDRLDADDEPVVFDGNADLGLAPEGAAVLPDVLEDEGFRKSLAGEGSPAHEPPDDPVEIQDLPGRIGSQHLVEAKALGLLRGITVEGLHGRADIGQVHLQVHGPDEIAHAVGDEAIPLLASAQGLLGAPSGGDVPHKPPESRRPTVPIPDERDGHRDGDP